ncbi:hypothetical protein [Streptomyces sp. GQFP]|uniref:hypothetical protein n=1 Tax=Streptomyces sp. GQFP TaxID=2907545 RepID=UPI001F3E2736|nr:hypothetical protein [Streptomyces sp. GQFP]UIX34839.1 hypothetical protein LUX31_35245 [Streptomyces sp. GQFP]
MRGVPRGGTRPLNRSARSIAPPGRRRQVVTGAALLLLAAGAGPAFAVSAGDANSPERDAQLVYCLAPAHRTDLRTAAVRLGLLKADADVTPEQWAKDHGDDFGRACAALMAAESDSPGTAAQAKEADKDGWLMTALKQLPLLLLGALLTLGGQSYERGSAERRSLRLELRTTENAYRDAVREYLDTYGVSYARADHSPVRSAREALTAALSRVPGPAARLAAAERIADGLPLAEPLPRSGDYLLDSETRTRIANEEHTAVASCLRSLPELNRSFPYWSWRTRRPGSAQSGASGGAE